MAMTSISDLTSSLLLRGRNSELKADLARLTQEVSSGRKASIAEAVGGNFRAVSSIERSLARLTAFETAAKETAGLADAMQTSLESIQGTVEDQVSDLLLSNTSGGNLQIDLLAENASAAFQDVVSKLNVQYADRSVFAGVGTDTSALADGSDMLAALQTAVAGEDTAAGVISVVDAWFAPGGDFETFANPGSSTPLASFSVSPDREVTLDTTATSAEIRDVLKGLAMAALMDDGLMATQSDEQVALATSASEALMAANDNLIGVQARIGTAQEAIEQAATEVSSEKDAMEVARSALIDVDPYDAAAELQQVEAQIELLYTLTARASRLRLTDYL